jgi:predicted unusual protein kinase regulating ubiquinone biosynthesis (AarF/ABC1/UbiB family)
VTPEGKLALIDFGLCAEVPLPDTRTLTLSIVHMMQGDMAGMIDDAIELDFLPPGNVCNVCKHRFRIFGQSNQ